MKQFEWPNTWAEQNRVEREYESKSNRIKFFEHLPGCIGFIAVDGEIIYYGDQWRTLKENGLL